MIYSFIDSITHGLKNETAQEKGFEHRCCNHQKDTSSKPRSGRFARIWIPRTELVVGFDCSDQPHHSSDCIDKFNCRIEILSDHTLGFEQTGSSSILCIGS